jgi:hypothetical protein
MLTRHTSTDKANIKNGEDKTPIKNPANDQSNQENIASVEGPPERAAQSKPASDAAGIEKKA